MEKIKLSDWNDAGKYIEELKIDISYYNIGTHNSPSYIWCAKTFSDSNIPKLVTSFNDDVLVALENLLFKLKS